MSYRIGSAARAKKKGNAFRDRASTRRTKKPNKKAVQVVELFGVLKSRGAPAVTASRWKNNWMEKGTTAGT